MMAEESARQAKENAAREKEENARVLAAQAERKAQQAALQEAAEKGMRVVCGVHAGMFCVVARECENE